jgi:hypothetical protein
MPDPGSHSQRPRPRLPLGTPVALRRATSGVPAGMIGRVVGYYVGETPDEIEYAVSFEPLDRLLRLPGAFLESDLGL